MNERTASLCSRYESATPAEVVLELALSDAMRRRHRFMLRLSAGVLLASFLLEVRPDERIQFRWLPAFPLPATCGSRLWFGVDCPGCGLTRSFVHLVHGDWQAALRAHRLGWLFVLLALAQIPYRTVALIRREEYPIGKRAAEWFAYGLIFLLIANWLLNRIP